MNKEKDLSYSQYIVNIESFIHNEKTEVKYILRADVIKN